MTTILPIYEIQLQIFRVFCTHEKHKHISHKNSQNCILYCRENVCFKLYQIKQCLKIILFQPYIATGNTLSPTQTDATQLDVTCCICLHTLLHVVGCCCTKFETGQTFSYMQKDTTTPNIVRSTMLGIVGSVCTQLCAFLDLLQFYIPLLVFSFSLYNFLQTKVLIRMVLVPSQTLHVFGKI